MDFLGKWRKVWKILCISSLWTTSHSFVDQLRNPWVFTRMFLDLSPSGGPDLSISMVHGKIFVRTMWKFWIEKLFKEKKEENFHALFSDSWKKMIYFLFSCSISSICIVYIGCLDLELEYIFCSLRTQRTCLRRAKSIPRTIISHSRWFSISILFLINDRFL